MMMIASVFATNTSSDVYVLIWELTQVVLALIGGFLGFRILFSVFIAQVDLAAGRAGALSDSAVEVIAALILLQLAYAAPEIGRAAAVISENAASQGVRAQDIVQLLNQILFTPLYELALVMAVCAAIVAVVLLAFKAQIAAMGGMAAQLGQSWLQAATAVLILTFGILALRVGLSIVTGA